MGGWLIWIDFLTLVYTAEPNVFSTVTHTQLHSQPSILPPPAPSTNIQAWPDNDDFGFYILYSLSLLTE